jgi:hypothetical protein
MYSEKFTAWVDDQTGMDPAKVLALVAEVTGGSDRGFGHLTTTAVPYTVEGLEGVFGSEAEAEKAKVGAAYAAFMAGDGDKGKALGEAQVETGEEALLWADGGRAAVLEHLMNGTCHVPAGKAKKGKEGPRDTEGRLKRGFDAVAKAIEANGGPLFGSPVKVTHDGDAIVPREVIGKGADGAPVYGKEADWASKKASTLANGLVKDAIGSVPVPTIVAHWYQYAGNADAKGAHLGA